ncbi:alpha-sarcoglycan isoform X1 [Musca domestica]|uniref:Alpha-sarcoglycan isoform X1 n=2 Tax=Musca domestica TaxID=7370 RepID=A0A1I8M566_MUSDO|nr:alpha-sarcoglycan isoform X1 [Musca domestica]
MLFKTKILFWCQTTALLLFGCLCATSNGQIVGQASVGELYTFKIEPSMFNWTHQVINEQFRYTPSLKSYPDLPSWMRYMYSHEHHAGFLYGTPPGRLAGKKITLEIVALNKQNYETRTAQLDITIASKFHAPNVVQMKIDNLNWVHLMDPGRVENLRNIFRKDLWPESESDLSLVFMESAVNMGGRLPLRPQQHEGVIVHLGSFAKFSDRLNQLQEEVRPLYKLPSCTYKRTSVQKIFENVGFKLDWCAFKMVGTDSAPEVLHHNHDTAANGNQNNNNNNRVIGQTEMLNLKRRTDRWHGMAREDVPIRNYIDEFAFAFAIPTVLFGLLCGILTATLCFRHQKLHDPKSEFFFDNIFHICEEECLESSPGSDTDSKQDHESYKETYPTTSSTVQMVQYSDTNSQPVTTLKSLKDPNCLLDNTSVRSQSPTSFYQTESPSNTYLRPKPPPYKGGTLTRSGGVDI